MKTPDILAFNMAIGGDNDHRAAWLLDHEDEIRAWLASGGVSPGGESRYVNLTADTLPYERVQSAALASAVRLQRGESLLVLQPFGWHLDGKHIPNAAEQFSRDSICEEHHWEVVCDYGPYVAVVRSLPIPVSPVPGDALKGTE